MAKRRTKTYKNLFHLSPIPNLTVLKPFIPETSQWGYENNKQKRVCFSTSIKKCLTAIHTCDRPYYVYTPVNQHKAYSPTCVEVFDVAVTNEKWITRPVKVKCIGVIVPSTTHTEQAVYFPMYCKTFKIFTYDWKWIEKYNQ